MLFARSLKKLVGQWGVAKRSTSPKLYRRMRLEPLETRRLLIASFSTSLHATMTIEDTLADGLIDIVDDVSESLSPSSSTTGFPSFVNTEGSSSYDADNRTLTIDVESNSAAVFTGGDLEQAIASGISRFAATLPVFNFSDRLSFQLTVRVEATFRFRGDLDHISEYAETVFALGLFGDPLDGLPDDGVVVPENRVDTRQPGREEGFELVTNTFFLNVQEVYNIWIPPSLRVDGSLVQVHAYSLGLFGQAGGAAASRYDGNSPLILGELPPGPEVISPPVSTGRTLSLTIPQDVTLEAPAELSPATTGYAIAADTDDPNPVVAYSDVVSPGEPSYLSVVTRTWTASNELGSTITGVQTITEVDTTPPVLVVPADFTIDPTGSHGASLDFAATATDAADPHPVISYDPPPGSVFPIGTSIVECTATDAAGNRTTSQFAVTVLGPVDLTQRLITSVMNLGLEPGLVTSFVAKLGGAAIILQDDNRGNDLAAVGLLRAFLREVQAQKNKTIPSAVADDWTAAATLIIDLLEMESAND